jgi:hypothetical protein
MMPNMWHVIRSIPMLGVLVRVAECQSEVNMCWKMLECLDSALEGSSLVRPSQSKRSRQWVKKSKSIVDQVNQWHEILVGQAPGDSSGHIYPNAVKISAIETKLSLTATTSTLLILYYKGEKRQ